MINNIDGATALRWITEFTESFARAQPRLTELDRLAGDGDFGTNLASALRRVAEALPTADAAGYRTVFAAASRGFLGTGGTSGPLFGMWFRDVSKAADREATPSELATGVSAGLATIQRLGGAAVGDNTMIDALAPAADALTDAVAGQASLVEALEQATDAAGAGANSTGALIASRGRASYVGELARGVFDPGAVTIALFFAAGATAAGSTRTWADLA